MTDERMALLELIEKEADGDLVREMLAFAAERLMEMEVEAVMGNNMVARSGPGSRRACGCAQAVRQGWCYSAYLMSPTQTVSDMSGRSRSQGRSV